MCLFFLLYFSLQDAILSAVLPLSPHGTILAQWARKLAQQNFRNKDKKVLFLFIQTFLSQKLMDLVQGHHDLYTNLSNWPSLKFFKGSTDCQNCRQICYVEPRTAIIIIVSFHFWSSYVCFFLSFSKQDAILSELRTDTLCRTENSNYIFSFVVLITTCIFFLSFSKQQAILSELRTDKLFRIKNSSYYNFLSS